MDERELNPETNLSAEELGRAWFEDQELFHHGVKGQKHGRRRYQNPDGSLTPLGRIHYGVGKAGKKVAGGVGKAAKKVAGGVKKAVAKKVEQNRIKKLMKKPIRKLTAEELAERTERTRKEEELSNAAKRARDAEAATRGFLRDFGHKMLHEAAVPAAIAAGKKSLEKLFGEGFDKAFGVGATNSYNILKKAGFDYSKLTDEESRALLTKTTADKKSKENLEFLGVLKGDKKAEKTSGDDDDQNSGNKPDKPNDQNSGNKSNKPDNQNSSGSNKPNKSDGQSSSGKKNKQASGDPGSKKGKKDKSEKQGTDQKSGKKTTKTEDKPVEPDSYHKTTSKTGTKGMKWEKRTTYELSDDEASISSIPTSIVPWRSSPARISSTGRNTSSVPKMADISNTPYGYNNANINRIFSKPAPMPSSSGPSPVTQTKTYKAGKSHVSKNRGMSYSEANDYVQQLLAKNQKMLDKWRNTD